MQVISDYLVSSTVLDDDGYIGIAVHINTYVKGVTTHMTPVAVYIMNHAMERVGREGNEPIISDLLDEGYMVITLDYLNNPLAVSPAIDWSIQGIKADINASDRYTAGNRRRRDYIYALPEGCRIVTDVLYYSLDKHASEGTLDHILNVWNNQFKDNSKSRRVPGGWLEASSISQLVKPDGSPIDLDLRMDIIYPSCPKNAPPVFMLASSSETRNASTVSKDRPQYIGMLMRGYAAVCYDHEYVPMARNDHYGYFDPHSLASYIGVKTHTAAIRRVRYLAESYGYDSERIGVAGHSKAGYTALLSNAAPEELPEYLSFDSGKNAFGVQPWLTYEGGRKDGMAISCHAQVAYHSMGNGTRRHRHYVDGTNSPTVIACGKLDSADPWSYWQEVQDTYESFDLVNLAISMSDLGHTYPYGTDPDLNYDRYTAVLDFFEYHLKSGTPPSPVYLGSAGDKVVLKFNAPMSRNSIEGGVKIMHIPSGEEISGRLSAKNGDTEWIFTSPEFEYGESYSIVIAAGVTDIKNVPVGKLTEYTFIPLLRTEGIDP